MTSDPLSSDAVPWDEHPDSLEVGAPLGLLPAKAGSTIPWALLRTARPRQWLKNVLVFAAPGAAGVLTARGIVARALISFALFSLAASGTYLLNDAIDHEADRRHPTKRHRPVAAGDLPVGLAKVIGVGLLVASLALAAPVDLRLALVLAIYVGVTISYSVWLKTEPVLDIAAVASGFVLRAIAGGVATDVRLSNWFLIVASFGSLFVVAGKRHAEHLDLDDERGRHRATLARYSLAYLRYVGSMASGVTVMAYCVWAFEKATLAGHGGFWFELSIVPFVVAILRYALLLDAGQGGAPEDVILGDRAIQAIGLTWLVVFSLGVYAG